MDVFSRIHKAIQEGKKSILVVLPCRSGKTPLATYITKLIHSQEGRVLFNVHRTVLLEQTSETFTKYDIPHGLLSPNYKQTNHDAQIGTIGTVYKRVDKINYPHVIISDEAHRDRAATREYIIRKFENSITIGLTATPVRLSGESLGDIYEHMIVGPSVHELIVKGYLCDYKLFCPPPKVDMTGVKKTAGDYNNKQLAKKTNTKIVTGDAISHYKKIIYKKQTVIFCVDIPHAIDTAEAYNNEGIPAGCLHSKLPYKTQREIVNKFVNKEFWVITNVDMITEGYDCPGIDAVQLLRKTLSLALHIQMSTRGMTIADGKEECFILDHVGNADEHGKVDSDFNWSLDNNKKKLDTLEGLQEKDINIKTCSECWYTYESTKKSCPLCGNVVVREPLKVTTIDQDLIITRGINKKVRELVGDNKIQGLSITDLSKRLECFKENNVPETSKHFIKVQKRYDTVKARSPEEILSVAIKWGYNIHWAVNRYITCNRLVGKGQAYNLLQVVCKQNNINLKEK